VVGQGRTGVLTTLDKRAGGLRGQGEGKDDQKQGRKTKEGNCRLGGSKK